MSVVQGHGKPTLAAVAREAGVSSPTVSKVINGREDVAESTRTKVLAALEQLGYQSPQQRKHAEGRIAIVEVVFDSLYSAYSVEVLNGVLEQAALVDVEILIDVTGHAPAMTLSPERRAQRILDEGRLGLIVVTSGFSTAQLSAFRRRHIPVVVIDPLNPPPSEVVSVGATNWAGGKAATEQLARARSPADRVPRRTGIGGMQPGTPPRLHGGTHGRRSPSAARIRHAG